MEIHTIGIDLGKTVFHLVGLNSRGKVVVRKKCSRDQILRFTANLQVSLIGMEACGGAHFLARALREQGHDARLMPAKYVKPYVKTNKTDYTDADAIAEAVGRPRMRFVTIKTDDQLDLLDLQSLHRGRNADSVFEHTFGDLPHVNENDLRFYTTGIVLRILRECRSSSDENRHWVFWILISNLLSICVLKHKSPGMGPHARGFAVRW